MRKPRRDKFEQWIDRHNHKLELVRTIFNVISGIAGTAAILKILGVF